jgi:hypothetical protein
MLKDRYFYPLAGLLIVAMVATALSFGGSRTIDAADIWRDGLTVEGEDLALLEAQPGTLSEYVASDGGEPAFARLSSNVARDIAPPGPGVFASIGPDYERAFGGRKLRLTITARASRTNGLDGFDMAYFTAGAGDSGWKPRELTLDWADYEMTFTPGVPGEGEPRDFFSIWPGTTAEQRFMDIRKMRVDVLDAPTD